MSNATSNTMPVFSTARAMEMSKASPDLDNAYEFAYKAMRFIETLRIMNIGEVTQ